MPSALVLMLFVACDTDRGSLEQVYAKQFTLRGQQHVSVSVALSPSTYRVLLTEEGVDARLRIVHPALLAEGTLRRYGRQSVVLAITRPQQLAIEIHGRDIARNQGQVTLTLDRLSKDPARETQRIRAERLLANAFRRIAVHTLEGSRAAERALQDAASILLDHNWEQDGNQALLELARLRYTYLGDWDGAATAARSVAAWGRANDDEVVAARADAMNAAALLERPRTGADAVRLLDAAEPLLTNACRVFEAKALALDYAECVNNLGLLDDYRGNFATAKATYQRALQLFQQAHDLFGEAKARQNIATVQYKSGHLSAAIDNYTQVLPLIDPQVQAQTDLYAAVVANLAKASAVRGDFQRALQLHGDALAIYQKLGREEDMASALYGLGSTYYLAGDPERALSDFERALLISKPKDNSKDKPKDSPNARAMWATLRAMGNALSELRRYPEALQRLRESLKFATTHTAHAASVLALAQVERQMGNVESAAERLRGLLPDVTDPVLRARIAAELARIDVQAGRPSSAIDAALAAAHSLERFELGAAAADAYATAAEAQLNLARTDAALQTLERSARLGDERNRRIWNPDLRASNAASQRRIQDLQVAALTLNARLGTDESGTWRAFWMADSFKARSLREQREQRARARPSQSRSVSARAAAEVRLAQLQLRVESLVASAGAADSRVVALLDEIRKLRVTLDTAPQGWQVANPLDRKPDDLLRTQIGARLPAGGTLLAYHLGEPRSHAWVISANRISQIELPGREAIATAVKLWLTDAQQTRSARVRDCGAALAQLILQPVAQLLHGDRLWVVPDAELNGVPFAALPASGDTACATPLIDRFTISYLPSVRFALDTGKPAAGTGDKRIAILADPIGVAQATTDIPPLPESRDEALKIAASLGSWNQLVLLGDKATRARLLSLPFDQLTVLHLATHARVRTEAPELSALYLSRTDSRGLRVPWQMTVADIRRYSVHADLVVLSACETSLGRSIDGEGPIGLTHAFLSAGARAVVTTDWRIADRATARLMQDFYAAFSKSTDAAAALAEAQRRAKAAEDFQRGQREWAAFRVVDGFN